MSFQGWAEPRSEELTFLRQTSGGCCSVAKSCLILQPHGLQHAWLPCPSQWVQVDEVNEVSCELGAQDTKASVNALSVVLAYFSYLLPFKGSLPHD